MRRLWRDIQAHKRAAVLFLVYWLATLVVIPMTWARGGGHPWLGCGTPPHYTPDCRCSCGTVAGVDAGTRDSLA